MIRQPPRLVDAVNHEELLAVTAPLVSNNTGHKECVTAQIARCLDLHLDHARGEAGDWDAERGRRPGGEGKLVP